MSALSSTAGKVLLLGAGYTLQRVASIFPNTQELVLTSTNSEKVARWREQGFSAELCDLTAPEQLAALFETHPAISTLVDSVPPLDTAKPTQGIENLYRSAQGRIQQAIYLSTTGVFGIKDGSLVSETSPAQPQTPSAMQRLASEQAHQRSAARCCILRIPAIYGPGRGIGHALRAGRYQLVDQGHRYTNRIQVDDLAQVIARLLEQDSSIWPAILCIGDTYPAPAAEVVAYYCQKFSLPQPKSIPYAEAKARGMYHQLSSQRIDSTRMQALLGASLRYPSFREGAETEFCGG
jgi:nucleoside-diphosphate-sugar epimerase